MRCSRPTFVPYSRLHKTQPRNLWMPRSFEGFVVPCGKCVNCVKSRQDDFACRIARCAQEYGNMIFVTFTYRDDTIPISCRLFQVDEDSGECVYSFDSHIIYDPDDDSPSLLPSLRQRFSVMASGRRSRHIICSAPFPSSDGLSYYYDFTPSLDRTDFRLWLKRERVNYKRSHGCRLPDFKYALIGEYGPRTCRPHFHACFMGLTYEIVNELCQSWRDRFGYVYIESVKRVNPDGSSGLLAASRYVGKYMSKGVVECDSVTDGSSQRPRLCASLNLGTQLSESEIFYYSAYDLYGIYDPERLCFLDKTPISSEQLKIIQREVFVRAKVTIDSHEFVLPRAIRDRLWKFSEKIYSYHDKLYTSKLDISSSFSKEIKVVKRSLVTCKLRTMAAVASSLDVLRFRSEQLRTYIASHPSGSVSSLVSQFEALQEFDSSVKEKVREEALQACYSGSIF